MHVTGIIAEYNPFHNGHLYQLTTCKEQNQADFVLAVMSGNFTQRGLPSIADKFTRTRMALACGIDMVLELPVPFATASAQRFAEASTSLLHKTGIVDTLSFGSELGQLDLLQTIAHLLKEEPPVFSTRLKQALQKGESFPRARQQALIQVLVSQGFSASLVEKTLETPNNILGIEYLRALDKWHSSILPTTIKRKGAGYHQTVIQTSIASATGIRQALAEGNKEAIIPCMPKASLSYLSHDTHSFPTLNHLGPLLQYKLMFSHKEDLYSIWDIPKELLHSIYATLGQTLDLEEIISRVTSKTYTRSTVQRSLLRLILSIKEEDMLSLQALEWIPYIRVLGCKKSAFPLLKELSQKATVPVITNLPRVYDQLSFEAKTLLTYEQHATQLYYYLQNQPQFYFQDFTQSFIKD